MREMAHLVWKKLNMSADSPMATVTDLAEYIEMGGLNEEFAWLRAQVADLRDSIIEPPAVLLPAIYGELDRMGRAQWLRSSPKWMAYAGGIAASAGALALATRTRRS